MPVISRFHGIVIKMYLRQKEHNPPHVHAIYGDCMGMFLLETGEMLEGDIPEKWQMFIREFIIFYQERLFLMWQTQNFEALPPIH